jgi:hypothetical protein
MAVATWRDCARPIIARVLKENEGKTEKEIRAALREAYPWGELAHHPYKIWCDEIHVQMDGRTKARKIVENPLQTSLF